MASVQRTGFQDNTGGIDKAIMTSTAGMADNLGKAVDFAREQRLRNTAAAMDILNGMAANPERFRDKNGAAELTIDAFGGYNGNKQFDSGRTAKYVDLSREGTGFNSTQNELNKEANAKQVLDAQNARNSLLSPIPELQQQLAQGGGSPIPTRSLTDTNQLVDEKQNKAMASAFDYQQKMKELQKTDKDGKTEYNRTKIYEQLKKEFPDIEKMSLSEKEDIVNNRIEDLDKEKKSLLEDPDLKAAGGVDENGNFRLEGWSKDKDGKMKISTSQNNKDSQTVGSSIGMKESFSMTADVDPTELTQVTGEKTTTYDPTLKDEIKTDVASLSFLSTLKQASDRMSGTYQAGTQNQYDNLVNKRLAWLDDAQKEMNKKGTVKELITATQKIGGAKKSITHEVDTKDNRNINNVNVGGSSFSANTNNGGGDKVKTGTVIIDGAAGVDFGNVSIYKDANGRSLFSDETPQFPINREWLPKNKVYNGGWKVSEFNEEMKKKGSGYTMSEGGVISKGGVKLGFYTFEDNKLKFKASQGAPTNWVADFTGIDFKESSTTGSSI
jgi:hypothetical protein